MGQFMRLSYLLYDKKDVDEGSGQLYWTVHGTSVFIAYVGSEGSDEPAHLISITTAFAARIGNMTHEAMSMKVQAQLCPF